MYPIRFVVISNKGQYLFPKAVGIRKSERYEVISFFGLEFLVLLFQDKRTSPMKFDTFLSTSKIALLCNNYLKKQDWNICANIKLYTKTSKLPHNKSRIALFISICCLLLPAFSLPLLVAN